MSEDKRHQLLKLRDAVTILYLEHGYGSEDLTDLIYDAVGIAKTEATLCADSTQ